MLRSLLIAILLSATLLTGCINDDDYAKAVTQFQQSSATLASGFQALITSANLTEENKYIDEQVFAAQPIDPAVIRARALLTPEEIALRVSAIKALADYTDALATLAAGKPAAQIDADAGKASDSLNKLTTDATTVLAHPSATSSTPNYAGPISSAASAIGQVIAILEKRHGEQEVKESLRKNDPQLTALFALLATESTDLYQRRRSALGETGDILFHDYSVARARPVPNTAELLQFSDRIKQYQRDSVLFGDADPAPAIHAFQDSHDKLVKAILAPKDKKKQSFAELIASLKSFAADVTPLAKT